MSNQITQPLTPFIEVKDLSVGFNTDAGLVKANSGLSYQVARGETLAIVGESGSGKSVASLAIMGLHNRARTAISGEILLHQGDSILDINRATDDQIRKIRGKEISMIFQDPMSSLHPFFSIGKQIAEGWLLHNEGSKQQARARAIQMLDFVGIPNAEKRVDDYPHQFSGGMRQRVMIAMALVNNPTLLIADEPTTALDVTVQAQILSLISDMQKEFNMAVIVITHDLGVVAQVSDRIQVMYGGRIVETGTTDDIFYRPSHPYTQGLLHSVPRVNEAGAERLSAIPGQPPSLINLPSGCAFNPRCGFVSKVSDGRCHIEIPELHQIAAGHQARCHLIEAGVSA
jgi:peptide/nickel transport system ATP-binding protein